MKWCCQEPGRICEAAFQAATATTVETPPPAADALRGGRLPAAAACRPSAVSLGCSTSELTKRVPFSRSQLWSWTERGGRCQPSPRPDRSQRLQLMLSCRTREITAALGLGLHLLLAAGEEPARVCDALGRMNRTDSGALARAEGGGEGGTCTSTPPRRCSCCPRRRASLAVASSWRVNVHCMARVSCNFLDPGPLSLTPPAPLCPPGLATILQAASQAEEDGR